MRRLQFLSAILAMMAMKSAFAQTFSADATLNFTGTIQLPSCTVDSSTANQTINLGSVPVLNLASTGATANPTAFNINVANCTAGTSVTMTVSGTAASVPSVLQNTGTATQVGVQILQANRVGATTGTPVTLNSGINLGTVDSTNSITIPLVAQLYRLGAATPGTVATTTTVNFTYN